MNAPREEARGERIGEEEGEREKEKKNKSAKVLTDAQSK